MDTERCANIKATTLSYMPSRSTAPLDVSVTKTSPSQQLKDSNDESTKTDLTIEHEFSCIICMDGAKSHIATPCGHLCVCETCCSALKHCPYCQTAVSNWMRAWIV